MKSWTSLFFIYICALSSVYCVVGELNINKFLLFNSCCNSKYTRLLLLLLIHQGTSTS